MGDTIGYSTFDQKLRRAFAAFDLADRLPAEILSPDARRAGGGGDWGPAVQEFRELLSTALAGLLTANHRFLDAPYVRLFRFDGGQTLNVAIVNQQSLDWYGSDVSIGSFDFLLEKERGYLSGRRRFLDLGGHQLVWSCFYAMQDGAEYVKAFEPSILNVAIGLLNAMMNEVIDRVDVEPVAVVAEAATPGGEASKMLVDFMNVSLRTKSLGGLADETFDFIKVDIEGYEYELLADAAVLGLIRRAAYCHFELHLGHLVNRQVTLEQCAHRLRDAKVAGEELYSRKELHAFLSGCDPTGYHSIVLKGSRA